MVRLAAAPGARSSINSAYYESPVMFSWVMNPEVADATGEAHGASIIGDITRRWMVGSVRRSSLLMP